jgi:hypothetical protein
VTVKLEFTMGDAIEELADEHTHEGHHGKGPEKKIGLMIAFMALFLALSEMNGKEHQTLALNSNIEASNLWNFYQAKTIRQTTLRTSAQALQLTPQGSTEEGKKQIAAWQRDVDRYESEPSSNEGRKELMARAKVLEEKRDMNFSKSHAYETSSLMLQLAIVLSSVALLSGILLFAFASASLGSLGVALLAGIYFDIPFIMHLLH